MKRFFLMITGALCLFFTLIALSCTSKKAPSEGVTIESSEEVNIREQERRERNYERNE